MKEIFEKLAKAYEEREKDTEAADDVLNEFFDEYVAGSFRNDKRYEELHEDIYKIIRERLGDGSEQSCSECLEATIEYLRTEPEPFRPQEEPEESEGVNPLQSLANALREAAGNIKEASESKSSPLQGVDEAKFAEHLKARGVTDEIFEKGMDVCRQFNQCARSDPGNKCGKEKEEAENVQAK